jgi:hypothetical protein
LDNPLGRIFNGSNAELRDVFDRLLSIDISFAARSMDLTFDEAPECVSWSVAVR